MLVQERSLDAFDEAIGERMTGLRLCSSDSEFGASLHEITLELASTVALNALERPASSLEIGMNLTQEPGRDLCSRITQEDLGPSGRTRPYHRP